MTDSQQNPSQPAKSANRQKLEEFVSPGFADAIGEYARDIANDVVDQRMSELTATVTDLVEQQRLIIAEARSLTPEQRTEVAPDVDSSTAKVKAVADSRNDLNERQRAGDDVSPEEIDQVERDMATASTEQAATERKLAAVRKVQEEDQPKQSPKKQPVKGSDSGSNDYVTHTELQSELDQLWAGIRNANGTASRAIAIARASASSGHAFGRAAFWWLITFLVVGMLYWLVFALTSLDWTLRDQFAWPFGLATLAGCIAAVFAHDSQSSAEAEAYNDNNQYPGRRQDDGLGVLGDRHEDQVTHHGHSSQASAHASAR